MLFVDVVQFLSPDEPSINIELLNGCFCFFFQLNLSPVNLSPFMVKFWVT